MGKIFTLIIILGFLLGCNQETKLESSNKNSFTELEKFAPLPDHSSPENLIKSLWQYKIWSDTVFFYDSTLAINNFYSDQYFKMNQNLMRERIDDIKKNGHYIEKNKVISSKVLSDSVVNVYTEELEYPGDKISTKRMYELIKSNNGWSINGCFKQCSFCEGSGKDAYNKDLKCKYCNGKGWEIQSAL